MESIASVKAIKYIYKYVYKGYNKTTMQFGRYDNEIQQYLDIHYISNCEAMWYLYLLPIQKHIPNVVCLQVHLKDQQSVVINPNGANNI